MLWKITNNSPVKIKETELQQEKFLEEQLEDWVAQDSSILGEPLLIFGQQVIVPDTKDRLDLLAVDTRGAITVIELKRGQLKDPVDMQSLRYASYVSRWRYQDFENVARKYFQKEGDPEFNFNRLFEDFCYDSGVDDVPDINTNQRIIILGSSVKERLGSVALWLSDHNIDIKLVEFQVYKDGETLIIEPTTIVPTPVSRFESVGKTINDSQPWISDGKTWHLDNKCSSKTKKMLLDLDNIIQDNLNYVEGPRWGQKEYITYSAKGFSWLLINTKPNLLVMDFIVKKGAFDAETIARELGIILFNPNESLSEKLNSSSTVLVENRNQNTDRIRLRAKEDLDVESEAFINFLNNAFEACCK